MILHGAEAGDGAPVVLLHGLFGSQSNFGALARRLAVDYRVMSLDLRNHGGSPQGPGMTYADMAEDVAETLDARGTGPVALVGHSMGGKVAMQVALTAPTRVRRLLVADIAPVRYPPHFRTIAAAMQAIPLHPGLLRAEADAALQPSVLDPAVRGFLLQNLRFGSAPAWRIGLDHIARSLPDIEGWDAPAATYDGPVLMLRGERSDYVQLEHRPAIRALFPRARFLALRDAGHWLHADAPEAFLSVVQEFLSRE